MPDDPDPPRKFYGLKPKEFTRVNAPTGASSKSGPTNPIASPDSSAGPIDVKDLARAAAAGFTPRAAKPAEATNDIHALLRENQHHANTAGLNNVALPPKRRSRRTRDYWLVMVPVNAFFAWWAFGPYANAVTFIYGIGGIGLFSASFTWVMWFVVEDY